MCERERERTQYVSVTMMKLCFPALVLLDGLLTLFSRCDAEYSSFAAHFQATVFTAEFNERTGSALSRITSVRTTLCCESERERERQTHTETKGKRHGCRGREKERGRKICGTHSSFDCRPFRCFAGSPALSRSHNISKQLMSTVKSKGATSTKNCPHSHSSPRPSRYAMKTPDWPSFCLR